MTAPDTGSHRTISTAKWPQEESEYAGESTLKEVRESRRDPAGSPRRVSRAQKPLLFRILSVFGIGATAGAVLSVLTWVWYTAEWKRGTDEQVASLAADVADLKSASSASRDREIQAAARIGELVGKVDTMSRDLAEVLRLEREAATALPSRYRGR